VSALVEVQILIDSEICDVVVGILVDDFSISGVEVMQSKVADLEGFQSDGVFQGFAPKSAEASEKQPNLAEDSETEHSAIRFWHPAEATAELETALASAKADICANRGKHDLKSVSIFETRITPFTDKPWMEIYREHFKPFMVGEHVALVPAWDAKALPDATVRVVINPGMAFGTGLHPTTRLMIKAMVKLYGLGFAPSSIADIGCGSGILAVVALKLWPDARLYAIDSESDAVAVVREHLLLNDVVNNDLNSDEAESSPHVVEHKGLGVDDISAQADLVLANINPTILLDQKKALCSILKSPAVLLLSGIVVEKAEGVQIAYSTQCKLDSRFSFEEDGWRALCFFKFTDADSDG